VPDGDNLNEQLASLHAISVEIAGLHELPEIHDLALGYCLQLTDSEFAFTGLLRDTNVGVIASGQIEVSEQVMEVAAIKGFVASPEFYRSFNLMALRSSVVGVAIKENRSYIANDVEHDPHAVGQPDGHPPVRRFLGVPLRLGDTVIGMIGVANKQDGYGPGDQQLLATFAGQVAVAVDNARLYERQRDLIAELRQMRERLTEVERTQLLGRERERIAGALHDRLDQQIFTIGVRLNALLEAGIAGPGFAQEVQDIRQLAIAASDEVRRAIFALTDPEHENDVADDLRSLLRELERGSDLRAHLSVSGNPTPAVDTVRDIVHVVVKEALTNVTKHAHATVVLVSLLHEADRLDLVIQDDGVGAREELLSTFEDSYLRFGLRHMRQLVVDRGGSFEVANGEETGLVVRVSLPLGRTEP
jgi:signal transduction histidine kinase